MKKILTASLVAMMAVTAANANIASTKYVDDRTGTLSGFVQENTNLTTAVNSLAATVSTNAGAASDAANQALTDAKAYTDALANGAVADNTAAIAGMDLASVGADGSYIKTVSQADGKVTAVAEAADATPTEDSTKMVTSGGVYEAIEAAKTAASGANSELAGRVDANEDAISALNTEQDAQDGKISALETSLASGATKQAIDAAKKAGDDAQATIDAYKTANDEALADGLALKEDVANRVVNASDVEEDKKSQQYPTIQYFEDELEAELDFATGEVMTEVQNVSTALSQEVMNRENADATQTTTITNAYTAAIKTETDARTAKDTELQNAINAINNDESGILAEAKKYSDDADTAQTAELKQYADQAEADAIAAAKTETTTQVNALANGAVKANTEAIAALDTTYAKDTDVESAIATAKGEAIADAKTETTNQVTALANGAVKTNTDAIDALEESLADGGDTDARFDEVEATANAAQVKSTVDFQFGGANGTWKDITTLPEYCGKTNATCSLVSKNGTIQWELVSY